MISIRYVPFTPHVFRLALNTAAVLMLAGIVALWARSYSRSDAVWWRGESQRDIGACTALGEVVVLWRTPLSGDDFDVGYGVWQRPAGRPIAPQDTLWAKYGFEYDNDDTGGHLAFPLWLPAALFALVPTGGLLRAWRRRRRYVCAVRRGRCTACGYDLRASVGRCPECGWTIPLPLADRPRVVLPTPPRLVP
jgi:hypothetical protein